MAPLWGHFVSRPSAVEDEDPVRAEQWRSGMPGCAVVHRHSAFDSSARVGGDYVN